MLYSEKVLNYKVQELLRKLEVVLLYILPFGNVLFWERDCTVPRQEALWHLECGYI